MIWNWQQPDWPNFRWDAARLAQAEQRFLLNGGVILGTLEHLQEAETKDLIVETMTSEALTTSEIEGELLDRASVQSSIRRHLGLAFDPVRGKPGEQGVSELMVSLYRTVTDPLDDAMMFGWNALLLKGRHDVRVMGGYRTHTEPMQVVSGRLDKPTVHFEAPPSEQVPEQMHRFVRWFNDTGPGGSLALPALTRSGLAHLYFVCVHPFEDGNGRIARAVSEKALAQGLGRPALTSLAATILRRRSQYYDQLEAANKRLEVTDWLAWFAGVALEAQNRTQARVEFVLAKTKLLDRLRGQLNQRQEKALLRMLREGPDGFRGGLSAGNYTAITKAPPATARRDLASLVELGALTRTGERKGTRYYLTVSLKPGSRIELRPDGSVVAEAG